MRITLNLSSEMIDALEKLERFTGNDFAGVFRRAIGTELFIRKAIAEGWTPYLIKNDVMVELIYED
jgi:hypothetical protein